VDPRGARLRCAHDEALSAAQLAQRLGAPAASGATVLTLAFATRRSSGALGASSARVWLPTAPIAAPAPLIVWAHGSMGLADACAPSRQPRGEESHVLPWVAAGYPVIAPDFAGLGTDGVQGYGDNHDTAQSVLDAARALRRLLPPGAADERVVLAGYSQGGGAVLAAQGLERSYGSGGRVVAVVAFAPQWFSRLDSLGAFSMLRAPDALTIGLGYTKPTVSVMRHYASVFNHVGPAAAREVFPPGQADAFEGALESLCLIPLGGWVQTKARVRDLMSEALRSSLLACHESRASPDCREPGRSHLARLEADLIAPDPAGAPVLYVQGSLDTVLPVAEEAACNVPLLRVAGVDVTVCVDAGATHASLIGRRLQYGVAWARAKLESGATPVCDCERPPDRAPESARVGLAGMAGRGDAQTR
jgi:predicted esterase